MAPQGNYIADIAILEGCTFLEKDTDVVVIRGIRLLSSGRVKRLIVVLHSNIPSDKVVTSGDDYPRLVRNELKTLGLKKKDFRIIETPIHHPATLTEAKVVLKTISKKNLKSAILLSHGFHTRRSYLAYQYMSLPFKIKILPSACLNSYEPFDNWWSYEQGRKYFFEETLKLAYYLIRGYIPLKLSY